MHITESYTSFGSKRHIRPKRVNEYEKKICFFSSIHPNQRCMQKKIGKEKLIRSSLKIVPFSYKTIVKGPMAFRTVDLICIILFSFLYDIFSILIDISTEKRSPESKQHQVTNALAFTNDTTFVTIKIALWKT